MSWSRALVCFWVVLGRDAKVFRVDFLGVSEELC